MRSLLAALSLLVISCSTPEPDLAEPLRAVDPAATWSLPTLRAEAHIVYTEAGVPHVYAADRRDLAVLWGFQMARDRFFMMDLSRRLALGELSEVLGRDALQTDMESRAEGNRAIAEAMLDLTEAHHPDFLELIDGYAEGVNAYIDAVRASTLPPPSEYALAAGALGADDPISLMQDYDRLDVVAGAATVLAMSGFEGGDVGRGRNLGRVDDHFAGYDHAELRQAGLRPDVWDRIDPVFHVASAPDWDPESHPRQRARAPQGQTQHVPDAPLDRILARRARWDLWRGHDWESGWGSNAWAVAADHTTDGRALLAGDGHLALTSPGLFYQIGLDTRLLSDDADEFRFMGMGVPGVPVPGPGTNGHIAWSNIAFFGDVTDWYREEVRLDDQGRPASAVFQGAVEPLVAHEETYVVRDVPLLDSIGGTETWTRWTTHDGRWVADIEGNTVSVDHQPDPGQTVVAMGGDFVVPADLDGDGVITAVSFDYTPLDGSSALIGLWDFAEARDVGEFHAGAKEMVGYAAGLVAADASGSVLYTGFQAVPCRTSLERRVDGSFVEGADPRYLLDGTRYGAFDVPMKDGRVDLSHADDPSRCLVPFDDFPHSVDPAQGYVVAANNDPGGQTFDGDLTNAGYYVGGPWLEGYRADTIDRELAALADADASDIAAMVEVQGNHDSRLGEQMLPVLRAALDRAEGLSTTDGPETPAEERLAALWEADADRLTEARTRLIDWGDAGFQARSGVDTFYDPIQPGDAEDSVATMVFNAWYGHFLRSVIDDERFPGGSFEPTGDSGRQRLIKRILLEGRGDDNPAGLASFNPDTGESIYFDVSGTEIVETSDELMIVALTAAMDFLSSPERQPGVGGFGTDDMDAWRWGYRHWVRFDSVLADFLGDDPALSALTAGFSITPKNFPVAPGLNPNDPRRKLPGFPRHGDHLNVDAGNSGTSGTQFDYGSGPVFRMVVALGEDGPEGVNMLPGGQSGLNDSEHFDDQARLWLGNDTLPMRYTVEEVMEGAERREVFVPAE